ncbi:hypothetical protein L596_017034 [Steinernema carpocapsae]|uniref:Uncharacterized protein n=1 Tax=Steinernema carpocapsae TaxID=34508 RepID=A0A4U5N177_STECR|nr:hypothetical protein L596_017034 [Steinernema carpocapsae]
MLSLYTVSFILFEYQVLPIVAKGRQGYLMANGINTQISAHRDHSRVAVIIPELPNPRGSERRRKETTNKSKTKERLSGEPKERNIGEPRGK